MMDDEIQRIITKTGRIQVINRERVLPKNLRFLNLPILKCVVGSHLT